MARSNRSKLDHYECEGQMSIFDFLNSLPKECSFSGHTCNKQNLWEIADTFDDFQCPHVCCRNCKTRLCGARCNGSEEPKKEIGKGNVFGYLRYGSHTLIQEVRDETKNYLEKCGVPDWVTWNKDDLPCQNCTWFDGTSCCGGAHTCHYEFEFLICDAFHQSIVERTPSTVGDAFPSKKIKKPINQDITDDYIKENPTCFYVIGHYLDREHGWHKVPEELPNFNTWQLVDVVLFGKKTDTAWMEHEKWEAKDWSFRSVDDRRNTETTEVLAWKLSDSTEE